MARILIVDDASFMRGSLKHIAETAGHEVVGMAKNGVQALELYKELTPDLVTLDVLMPVADGLGTLKAIIAEDSKAKVIMITALGMEEKKEEARKLGASGYIRKPFTLDEIAEEITRVLGEEGRV